MKFIFACPKCQTVYANETESAFDVVSCPECNIVMHYTGLTKETWNALSKEEQAQLKETVLNDYKLPHTMYTKRLSNDIHTIKNILIFFLIVSIIGIVVTLIL